MILGVRMTTMEITVRKWIVNVTMENVKVSTSVSVMTAGLVTCVICRTVSKYVFKHLKTKPSRNDVVDKT